MTITRPVPESAHPAIQVLRDLPRPLYLPSCLPDGPLCFWDRESHFPMSPLGFHPLRRNHWPRSWEDLPLPGLSSEAIAAFNDWWEEQTDPHSALSAVWEDPSPVFPFSF